MWTERRETLALLKHSLRMDLQKAPGWFQYTGPYGGLAKARLMLTCPVCQKPVLDKTKNITSHVERHTRKDLEQWFMLKAFS